MRPQSSGKKQPAPLSWVIKGGPTVTCELVCGRAAQNVAAADDCFLFSLRSCACGRQWAINLRCGEFVWNGKCLWSQRGGLGTRPWGSHFCPPGAGSGRPIRASTVPCRFLLPSLPPFPPSEGNAKLQSNVNTPQSQWRGPLEKPTPR
jgi:hypothetical protein